MAAIGTDRSAARRTWLEQTLAARGEYLLEAPSALTADASFRRFERVRTDAGSRVLMDAPPDTEKNPEFITLAGWLERHDLPAARVLEGDPDRGFLLVTDLGDRTLARALEDSDRIGRDVLYRRALDLLVRLQRAALDDPPPVPDYDAERLALENSLFGEWYLKGLLGLAPPAVLSGVLEDLTRAHLEAPRTLVHLDWHSRNLMVAGDGSLAIVDFQDARRGPAPYDVVSLLRDCYQRHSAEDLASWYGHYLTRAARAGIPGTDDPSAFRRSFDLVGIQRHLKAIGIFARLHLRDGRDHALADIPRVLAHLLDVTPLHDETRALGDWLRREVVPAEAARGS
ncbi:MAG: phosphotransferase [Gammaproteobacteria bacterium]|nr:phosphotransferase [Gammaproteobacteria bacterium]